MKLQESHGNMYDWISHMWSPIQGCPHQCTYCYVRTTKELNERPRLVDNDFPDLGTGKTIFVCHQCDLFADAVSFEDIYRIMEHCWKYPDNQYMFQTKNPRRILEYCDEVEETLPLNSLVGCTIETNRQDLLDAVSKAPKVAERAKYMHVLPWSKFVTVEPILQFDVGELVNLIAQCGPQWVNIGADSKGHGLLEPTYDEVIALADELTVRGIKVLEKHNMERLRRMQP